MSTDSLRVALVSVHGCPLARLGEKDTGGMNVYLLQLTKELGALGITADVYTRFHDPKDPEIVDLGPGARVIHVKAGPWYETKDGIYPLLPEFVENMLRFQRDRGLFYDLYHSHYWLSGEVVARLNQRERLPHVASFHTLGEAKVRARAEENESEVRIRSERDILHRADRIVAVSEHERGNMIDFYGAPGDRIQVIPCGVDMGIFKPMPKDQARAVLGLGPEKVLLYVGRVQPLKGPELLLEGVARLGAQTGLKVLIVGGAVTGDVEVDKVRRLAEELGIGRMVSFEGTVPHKKLVHYYNAADLCVVPSFYESFGLVAAEAMACGTPVVATAVGGLPETVKDGLNGCLVRNRKPEALAEKVSLLLDDPQLRGLLASRARESVAGLDWPRVAGRVAGLYESVYRAVN